jgi:hypothetical protein
MDQIECGPFSVESWEYAIAYADSLGRPPHSIAFLVRSLLSDDDHGVDSSQYGGVGRDSCMFLSRFLKSRAFRSPYFFALSMFKPERLGDRNDPFLTRDFLEAFSCNEHAFLSAMIFIHRMAARRTDEVLMRNVTDLLQRSLNLGWFVGKALRPVGQQCGMVIGAARWLGLLPLVRHDSDGVWSYLKHIKSSEKATTDSKYETERWGCASIQIALLMLQRFGFGSHKLVPLMRALTTLGVIHSGEPAEKAYRVAEFWIRYMLESRTVPSVPLQPAYYLERELISQIADRVLQSSNAITMNWLSATPHDVTNESAPQLLCGAHDSDSDDELKLTEDVVV